MEQATCAVDGCNRARRGTRTEWCNTHYFRVYRNGHPGPAEIAVKGVFKSCAFDGCDARATALSYCNKHYLRLRTHGDPAHVSAPPSGAEHPSWSGEAATYDAMHGRVRAAKGSASNYECVRCTARARHWAYDHSDPNERRELVRGGPRPVPYSLDVERYQPMCVPCHKRMDLDYLQDVG